MSEYARSTLLGSPSLDFMYMSASAPEAPPLSDTIIGCFMRLFFWIAACIMRAIWSEAPPAPAATTISTGLVGSQAANAGAVPSIAAAMPAIFTTFRIWFSLKSLSVRLCADFCTESRWQNPPSLVALRLFTLEVRRALVEERVHPLAKILAHIGAQDQVLALLAAQRAADAAHRLLGHFQRDRR